MKKIVIAILSVIGSLASLCSYGQHPAIGQVVDGDTGIPLEGVTVTVWGTTSGARTNSTGYFTFMQLQDSTRIVFTFLGYKKQVTTVRLPQKEPLLVRMYVSAERLEEVTVSTGFQNLRSGQATGSFVKIDNDLLNRRVSPNILDRLGDVAPGLIFNRNKNAGGSISIRGQSTIFANADPLIVVDNFPYSGNINDINPNDVQSITLLKDAAAASIWGARSGNGVIVITTKRGRINQPLKLSFNSNVTVGQKPNLFYQSRMSSADFIDVEEMLFNKGYYQSAETSLSRKALTPVVELLIAKRDGLIAAQEADHMIGELKQRDFRDDFVRYFYRNSVNQQYAFNMNGGSEKQVYNLSAGYDHIAAPLKGSDNGRMTLNAGNTFYFIHKKASLSTNFWITEGRVSDNGMDMSFLALDSSNPSYSVYPYVRFVGENGLPLAIPHDYRTTYINAVEGLLDWSYKPLDELALNNNHSRNTNYRIHAVGGYEIVSGLRLQFLYQYNRALTHTENLHSLQSYYTRNMINRFTQEDGGVYTYAVPMGSIVDYSDGFQTSQNFRTQVDYSKNWKDGRLQMDALAGYEVQQTKYHSNSSRFYGYDESHAASAAVDYVSEYPQFQNRSSLQQIPSSDDVSITRDNYVSYFANAVVNLDRKYSLSGSLRFDQSNLFGVDANQKGVPLWSAGLEWNISKEDFYKLAFLPELRLKLSYGVTGNVNKAVTAYTTATYFGSSLSSINLPFANVTNPPNPSLRWERVKILNTALSFGTVVNRVNGTVEFYRKWGSNLIGDNPFPPSSGISLFRNNSADTRGTGIDISLQTRNLDRKFKWTTDYLYSRIHDKVTSYYSTATPMNYIANAEGGGYPLKGHPLYSLYSFRWAGLDPSTGDPQGFLDGEVSKNYSNIISRTTLDDMVYNGSARPTRFGAIRNTFSYKNISLSLNVSYRLGYYFRENGISYTNILSGLGYNYGIYSMRWQKPGDEKFTQVPSMPSSSNNNRDYLYNYSDILVKKGDHIRLQDISLSYSIPGKIASRWKLDHVDFYLYANNIGMLWKAYGGKMDPDYVLSAYKPVRTISAGIRLSL